jgi:hypothetical protein
MWAEVSGGSIGNVCTLKLTLPALSENDQSCSAKLTTLACAE